MSRSENPKFAEEVFRQLRCQYRRCLWHTMACANPAIQAHSVQNSRVLDRIAEDGHVTMVQPRMRREGLSLDFEKVGRNKATTFLGLCAEHDAAIFRPIDTSPIDPQNAEHLFLIAYRSVFKGFHSALHSALMVQGMFLKGVEFGELDEDGVEMQLATGQILSALTFQPYMDHFHQAFRTQNWSDVRHETLLIKTSHPPLAGTTVAMPVEAEATQPRELPLLLVFNVFPLDRNLYVQFSWHPEADSFMQRVIAPFLAASGDHLLYLLSKHVLKYAETFVLSPSTCAAFSEEQLVEIQRFFVENTMGRKDRDDPKLFLFGSVET